ncbi:hypothetical protein, partial [Tepidiforma sp.]|uniref:hypothetical protein n=1 Tax=Tepidiforma sp. TaxID=2682230 RepID=UPI00261EACB3
RHSHFLYQNGSKRCNGLAAYANGELVATKLRMDEPPEFYELPTDAVSAMCETLFVHDDDCRCPDCEHAFYVKGACYEYWDEVIERWQATYGAVAPTLRMVRRLLDDRWATVQYSWLCDDEISTVPLYRKLSRFLKSLSPYELAFIRASLGDAPSPWMMVQDERAARDGRRDAPYHRHVRTPRDADTIDEQIVPDQDTPYDTTGVQVWRCCKASCRIGSSFALRRCWG